MLNPIFKMTGILVLSVLATIALFFIFRYLYVKKRLPSRFSTKSLNEYSDGSYGGRHYAYYLVYCHYVAKYAFIAYKWISQTLHIKIRHPSNSSSHECYETTSNSFIQLRHFPIQISTIVNKLRRRVNESGKEPFKPPKMNIIFRMFLIVVRNGESALGFDDRLTKRQPG
jgi:hypothetical protein